jgi:hypothetical protein
MATPGQGSEGLAAVAELDAALLRAIDPFVRYEHPQGRLALSVDVTRPRVAHAASPSWTAADGAARLELPAGAGGAPAALLLRPGRLAADEGFVTLRTRCRLEGAAPAAAPLAAELLDGIFGYVRRPREPAPETRLDDGVLVWERPVNRCEVLLVLQRALGRPLAGEVPFRFADDRIVLDVSDLGDPRWETTGGLGVFDPWPFAVWLARRHVKLLRPALRVAIEPDRAARPAATAAPPPAPKAKAPRRAKATAPRAGRPAAKRGAKAAGRHAPAPRAR